MKHEERPRKRKGAWRKLLKLLVMALHSQQMYYPQPPNMAQQCQAVIGTLSWFILFHLGKHQRIDLLQAAVMVKLSLLIS